VADSHDIAAILAEHDAWVDAKALTFRERMLRIAEIAALYAARTIERQAVRDGLIVSGALVPKASAQRLMRRADQIFLDRLEKEGWFLTVEALTAQLAVPGTQQRQAILFDRTFKAINSGLKKPLPMPDWRADDRRYFESRRITTSQALNYEVERIAKSATNRVLLNSGAVSFSELMTVLTTTIGRGFNNLESLAATALSTHYRTLHDRSFTLIEEQADVKLKLTYSGPRDKRNRPFCRRMLSEGPRTRAEIQKLRAPGGLPVLTAGGGYNCRHVWIMTDVK